MNKAIFIAAALVFTLWCIISPSSPWNLFAIAGFWLGAAIFNAVDDIAHNTKCALSLRQESRP